MSQRVRLEWFEHTAQLVLAGLVRAEIEAELKTLLKDKLSIGGTAVRGNREKVITILLRTWVDVDEDLEPLHLDGLQLLRDLPLPDRLVVHWGMAMAAYPFWGQVAETVGRLLHLQGNVGAAEVQRRMRELRGERETVARAARRVLRAFNDWGVLVDSARKGTYRASSQVEVEQPGLAAFLAEAWLRGSGAKAAPVNSLLGSPSLFPFSLEPTALAALARHPRLEVYRHGGDEQVFGLREQG
ncbi:MAG: hypothetical protein HY900_35760 [Deltaproteobacteria bacterium]|nr:hypothetical protein [Deltaproteobacteria bacterium]